MQRPAYTRADFGHSPLLVFYETTRACDLMCQHCRAVAQPHRHPFELSTELSLRLIDALARFPKPPLLVLTGGDPIKREDVFDLIAQARQRGLQVAMTPSATPLMTRQVVGRLKDAGLHALAVSLDGCDAATHDGFRRVAGSFARTLEIVRWAGEAQLPIQINTTIARHNVSQLDEIAELLSPMNIVLWSVFFLVPVGRGSAQMRISAAEFESVFETLYERGKRLPFAIKTTEAPHYRRFVAQKKKAERGARPAPSVMVGTNDGRGVMFVSHTGEIYPSGFLPILCGRFPKDSPIDVYQRSPLFVQLRNPDQLGGKCGRCEFRNICGGSRARSYALTGNPMAAEPDCAYEPACRDVEMEPQMNTDAHR